MLSAQDIENILNRIQEWLRGADQKVSIFLAFQGVVITILATPVFSWLRSNWISVNCPSKIILFLGIGCITYSVIESAICIFPRLSKKDHPFSITFFGDIAQQSLAEYRAKLDQTTDETYRDELIAQVHINSGIASRKHRHFRKSLIFFGAGIALVILAYSISI